MRHFVEDDYDAMAEYEMHVGGPHYEADDNSYDRGIMWREEYENEFDDYDRSILNHE